MGSRLRLPQEKQAWSPPPLSGVLSNTSIKSSAAVVFKFSLTHSRKTTFVSLSAGGWLAAKKKIIFFVGVIMIVVCRLCSVHAKITNSKESGLLTWTR